MRPWQILHLVTALAPTAAAFPPEDVITRDVCIVGGGATGTYAAVQLVERGHSIVIVEQKDRLGGHAETLYLPSGEYLNYGVQGYFNERIVRNFFSQLNVDYEVYTPPSIHSDSINFQTGERVTSNDSPLGTFLGALQYHAAVGQFDYLATGAFYLPDEVPEVLLRPFREFVTAYGLQSVLPIVFTWTDVAGNILDKPTFYVIRNFSISHLQALLRGPGIRPKNGTQTLFRQAAKYIDENYNILYQTTVKRATRNSSGVELVVESTGGGRKLIRAKKLLIAFPPLLSNLQGFDLSEEELVLFGKWAYMTYYGVVVSNTGVPDGLSLANRNPNNQPGSLPLTPFESVMDYSGVPGHHTTRIVGDANFTEEDAKQLVLDDLRRMGEAGTFPVNETPEIIAFASHSPELLTVPVGDVRNGFFKRLYALQGQQSTYYTGHAFCTDYSPQLWNYTLSVVNMMDLV
ncbi:hypothetical protein BDW59DRAFT_17986 [Aspergillus cavernicola]|uniref:Amine oxidase domain-containing protein n=1 Tax=Aspergillus cavernicola TaxID=176166 RepID=A0ABR4IUB9_9EURO